MTMVTFPNAKINIGLQILRRRPDGYHDIATVMVPTAWCDILEITPLEEGKEDALYCSGLPVDCPPEKNLVMKAVKTMRKYADFPPVQIHLHKVIPSGAGLGGGSADATFALTCINELFGLGFSTVDLERMASGLGADCAFFVENTGKYCTGIGDVMMPVNLHIPAGCLVIVKPPVEVSTVLAYSGTIADDTGKPLVEILADTPFEQWQDVVCNDFEPSVFKLFPQIAHVKRRLLDMGATYASMSGSGASVYGFFPDIMDVHDLHHAFPGCEIFSQAFHMP